MKHREVRFFFFTTIFAFITLACLIPGTRNTPTAVPPPTDATANSTPGQSDNQPGTIRLGIIQSVTMAPEVNGDSIDPINPTINFNNPAVLHAVVKLKEAPGGTRIKVEWFTNQVSSSAPDSSMGSYELATSGSRNLDFSFKPKSPLPSGTYYVQVFLNGEFFVRVDFNVTSQ